jgi:hypothetical protein
MSEEYFYCAVGTESFHTIQVKLILSGSVMTEAVSHRPPKAEARVRSSSMRVTFMVEGVALG